jgi:hypothetical protein
VKRKPQRFLNQAGSAANQVDWRQFKRRRELQQKQQGGS